MNIRFPWILICLFGVQTALFAQTPSAPGYPALVTDNKTGRVNSVRAVKYSDGQLYFHVGAGTVSLPADGIAKVEFDLPPSVLQASEAYRNGDAALAAKLYRDLEPFRQFAGLPDCNVSEEFLNYADSRRQMRRYKEAETLLDSLDLTGNDEARLRATLIRAFVLCDRNEIDAAEELMRGFPETAQEDFNFPLDRIVRTRIHLARGNYHEAALAAAEAVAGTRIESPIYPETLYLAASCYEKMGEVTAEQRAAREQDNEEKLMAESIDYTAVAEAVRQELAITFPKSQWARLKPVSVEQILDAASSIQLSNEDETPDDEKKSENATTSAPPGESGQ